MNLILDFGNTNCKLALFQNGQMMELTLFREISLERVQNYIKQRPGITNCILSTVIDYPRVIRKFLQDSFFFIDLNENTPIPIENLYRSKKSLGKDRLAAAVGGASHFPGQNVLVINAGTCITYEFVHSSGAYHGGAISPGLEMRLKALNTFTDKLPLVTFTAMDDFIGNTTEESILSGVFYGAIAEIESLTTKYLDHFPDLRVILSGGDLNYFDKRLKVSIFAFPNIVIHGLQQILEFNVKTTN